MVHHYLSALLLIGAVLFGGSAKAEAPKPNILVIVADDMGWSDMGAFGGEIRTPNLDALAAAGTAFTDFYVAPTCSPTRSMLLTGVDNHLAGVGTMADLEAPNQRDSVAYGAQLHDGVVTIAEVLQREGYATLMSGKWHLAREEAQYPNRRGFDRSFVLLNGGASHFGDALALHKDDVPVYLEDGEPTELPADFYSSISYTDKMIAYLGEADRAQPFFAYLAYTAPHDPLQVPDDWLDRYAGAYDGGPDAVRSTRINRLQEMGLFPEGAGLWETISFPGWLPLYRAPWDERSEEQREADARSMEIYASMIELMDQQIGRVLAHLESTGQLENTYVLFMSDNGSSGATPLLYPFMTRDWWLDERDHRPEVQGRPGSHVFLGSEWATASNAPWKLYKGTVGEGGIRSPLLVAGPGVTSGARDTEIAHVTDFVPTVLDWAGLRGRVAELYEGRLAPGGTSFAPRLVADAAVEDSGRTFAMELFDNKVVRDGRWKAHWIGRPFGSGTWELYDLGADPGEVDNLAEAHPERLADMIASYDVFAAESGVIAPSEPPINLELDRLYVGECNWWCETRFAVINWLIALFG